VGIRSSLKNATNWILCAVGADGASRRSGQSKLLILCYHGIRRDDDPERSWLLLPGGEFERQIKYLSDYYRVRFLDDVLDDLGAGVLTEPTACVTFDDGYLNNYSIAYPVLQKYGVPATIYLATGLIGSERMLWTTTLELALSTSLPLSVDAEREGLGVRVLRTRAEARSFAKAIADRLKALPAATRAARLSELFGALPPDAAPLNMNYAMMSWSQAEELAASGLIQFGAHTVNHEIVSTLDDTDLDREITASVEMVRALLSKSGRRALSQTFAYPNGRPQDFDDRSKRLLQSNGIRAAVTTIDGMNEPERDRFSLRRFVVGGDISFEQFRVQASGITARLKGLAHQ
jgi:peptidoglycan/xylan/chitin deacetylase (PgdA/CDA1 family)